MFPWSAHFLLRTLANAVDLYGYGHSKIGMVGTIMFSVRYGTKALPAFTFQVSHQGANLMGFDLFCELGFTLVDNYGAAILGPSVCSPWHQRWPALFSGLGCLTAFDHQPLLKSEVRPVIQRIRCLPLTLRDDVNAELQMFLDAGIIECIDASPWISNLVAKKKSGGLRPSINLRPVNKAVVPDTCLLPTVEELAAQFYGPSVFTKLNLRQGNLTAFVMHVSVFWGSA